MQIVLRNGASTLATSPPQTTAPTRRTPGHLISHIKTGIWCVTAFTVHSLRQELHSMNAYQKSKQKEAKMERLKDRRERLGQLLQAERDELEVKMRSTTKIFCFLCCTPATMMRAHDNNIPYKMNIWWIHHFWVIGRFYIGERYCILHSLGNKKDNLAKFNLVDIRNSPNRQNKFYDKFSSYTVIMYKNVYLIKCNLLYFKLL